MTSLWEAEVMPVSECGGVGTCGDCRVRFLEDAPSPGPEDLALLGRSLVADGWRLSCQVVPSADCHIEIEKVEPRADIRVLTESSAVGPPPRTEVGPEPASGFGVAVDVGTTTTVCYLMDLAAQRQVDVAAFANPQIRFGSDVITRIVHAHEGEAQLEELQRCLVSRIEDGVLEMCRRHAVEASDLLRMTAVGNSTMMHLLWGVDPWSLGVAPFQPRFTETEPRPGSSLGLRELPDVVVELLPGIGGQLGSDTVAGLLALELEETSKPTLFLDLGTNGEIALFGPRGAIACSCAAGPAFEGVHISCGTAAVPGAIEHVDLTGAELRVTSIDDAEPIGLCGSGLADAVALLLHCGLLRPNGRLLSRAEAPASVSLELLGRLHEADGQRAFALHRNAGSHSISLTQGDIRQLQLAKSAFRTGVEYLLDEMNMDAAAVEQVYVGGGFGSHLRVASLIDLGVLPAALRGRVNSVGNIAGLGAQIALGSGAARARARRIGRRVEGLALERWPKFSDQFAEHLFFPEVGAGGSDG
jgi:uncharacterized 2Fe-2S/4Fe-4S cluster protein (DUF4445 family)